MTVQLPIAYSPFFNFTQSDLFLEAHPDLQGRAVITTNDLMLPIKAQYRLPLICYVAPIVGLILLFGLVIGRRFRGGFQKMTSYFIGELYLFVFRERK